MTTNVTTFLTYLAGKDREIGSRDGARFSCLRTGV